MHDWKLSYKSVFYRMTHLILSYKLVFLGRRFSSEIFLDYLPSRNAGMVEVEKTKEIRRGPDSQSGDREKRP